MSRELTQAELAKVLGISSAMVSKLHRRGMPLDEPGARAWRQRNLSRFRTKGQRIDGNTGLRPGARAHGPKWTPAELMELAEDIGRIMARDGGALMAEGMPHLLSVLRCLSYDELQRVQLPPAVVAALESACRPESRA